MADTLLAPLPDETSQPFWDGVAAGELRVQRCGACGALRFPPRPMCPSCQSLAVRWEAVSGRGSVWSFVVPHPPLLPAYAALVPYNVVLVALDEHPTVRMVGNLLSEDGGGFADPGTITIGDRVRVVFAARDDGVVLPQWVPA